MDTSSTGAALRTLISYAEVMKSYETAVTNGSHDMTKRLQAIKTLYFIWLHMVLLN